MFERKIETHQQEEAFMGLEAAKQYVESAQKSTMRYRTFLENLEILNIEGRYLDVGAGPGILAGIIAQHNPNVEIIALEVSADMVAIGKDYLKSKGLENRVEFVIGDATDEGVIQKLGKFDLVYSTYSLHHWQHPRKVIDNLMTRLADEGVLFVHDLRRVWWLYWLPIQNGFLQSVRASYLREEVEEILKGFDPESYEIKNEFPFLLSVIIKSRT
jgi:2-polyprenyl-3-methyl-5-hydroxy-6-metoxy-1,4-benzoquinol methylase